MKNFVTALVIVALLAFVGLLATSDNATIEAHANEVQKVSTLLK